jgi:biopolymer transport protein ExbD
MRIADRTYRGIVEGDLTPMIDMTFLLIAFFMLVINFSEAEQDQRITLPVSELAKPPESPYEDEMTIHLTAGGRYAFGGRDLTSIDELRSALLLEKQIIDRRPDKELADVTIIIRGDEDAQVGWVQEIMQACQELQFENFALRGKQGEARRNEAM